MKKQIIIILTILLYSCTGDGGTQLVKNEVDSFTGHKIKRTTFEKASNHYAFSPKMFNFVRFSKINDNFVLDLKTTLVSGSVFAINKDDFLMIKLNSGEIIKLQSLQYKISCKGCGAEGLANSGVEGILQNYYIDEAQIKKIASDPPVLMRVYLTEGYVEEAVPTEEASNISKIASLIIQ